MSAMTNPYDINAFKNPLFTVDSVLFTVKDDALKVLMVKRANEPFIGSWGLPGGFVDVDSNATTDVITLRKLEKRVLHRNALNNYKRFLVLTVILEVF